MRLVGSITKQGKWWAIDIPLLGIATQGRTKKEAYEMIVDAVQELAHPDSFPVQVHARAGSYFEVGSENSSALAAFFLKRYRQIHGLSLAEVSQRLGLKSRNAYARYEQGKAVPTVDKLTQLLKAITPGRDLVLSLSAVAG